MRTFAIALGALAASACASPQHSSSGLDNSLARYVGLPKQQIAARLGAPEVEGRVGNRTAWAWSVRTRQHPPMIVTLKTTGGDPGVPFSAELVSDGGSPNHAECELRIVMSADGEEAERTEWFGDRHLCRSYLSTLERAGGRAEPTS
jgi:hypothetical protein